MIQITLPDGSQKSFEKGVDKGGRWWYTVQAVAENRTANRSLKIEQQQCTKDSENSFEFKRSSNK